jgi:hypothetical protein
MQLHLEHRVIDPELRRKALDCVQVSVFPQDVKDILKYALEAAVSLDNFLEEQRIKREKLLRLAGKVPVESVQTLFGEDFRETDLEDDAEVEEDNNDSTSDDSELRPPKPKDGTSRPKKRKKAKVTLLSPTRRIESKIDDHETGCSCNQCLTGKLYPDTPRSSKIILHAKAFELVIVEREALRCRSCENKVIAPAPDVLRHSACGLHASFIAELADLKYRLGMPSLRMERKLELEGLVVSDSRQFEALAWASERLAPLFTEFCWQAANAACVSRDDSPHRILDHQNLVRKLRSAGDKSQRVGVFTSCFRATTVDGHALVLYYTDPRHNGEVFSEILEQRESEEPLISISDASSMNFKGVPSELLISALCLTHARRKFYDIGRSYPLLSLQFLSLFDKLFLNDRKIKEKTQDPVERLRLHQEWSEPVLVELSNHLAHSMGLHPPNTYLGDALRYLHEHWDGLTLFTRLPGVPLSTNDVERDLKKAIRHRNNSMNFKSLHGARVGSTLTSFLLSAEENGLSPPRYLTTLLTHPEDLWRNPKDFLPWVVAKTLPNLQNQT